MHSVRPDLLFGKDYRINDLPQNSYLYRAPLVNAANTENGSSPVLELCTECTVD